ncbi:MAG TPA: YdiU family protein [Verrucomicrobiales bacterium]|nr:YdiU family protein [Verrucomicrobiales bacterium]|tara:strand:+ start:320 stop:1774 length:1455 start_codon:yes stop_codon:yes gene_type:complete
MTNFGFKFDNTYLHLPKVFYTKLPPTPVPKPKLVVLNTPLATDLGLNFSDISSGQQAALFAGSQIPEEAESFAQAYAGHQFGHFTMLGDGRAIVWGEHITPRGKRVDLQFKGSGPTPYSRGGDGRAAIGPMLREYIISEAMHALNIPTTRSLAVVTNGEQVYRETPLPGAILTRVASSHIRVGTFQFAALQQDREAIKSLFDYTIKRHPPHIVEKPHKPLSLLKSVIEKQAELMTHWMRVGFVHGVMNTDNMALSGETIDYGPCAFMDTYDPDTVFSSIDHMRRYAYANQPAIAQWNLARFAETLLPLLDDDLDKATEVAEEAINGFGVVYKEKSLSMLRGKIGLFGEQSEDESLITDLLTWMHQQNADYTNTFMDLTNELPPKGECYERDDFKEWYARWQVRLTKNTEPLESSLSLMRSNNPVVIPRNHRVEQVLDAATNGDLQPLEDLLAVLQEPYNYRRDLKSYQLPPKPEEKVCQTFCGT